MKYIYDDLDGKSILITGGAGFIGSNLAKYLNYYHPKAKIVIFDKFRDGARFNNGNPTSLGHFSNLVDFKGEIIIGDLANKEDLQKLNDFSFDYIFHNGAISDTTCDNQNLVLKTNFESFEFFIDKIKENNATLIYASSAAIYGNTTTACEVGINEIPQNVYGYSKLLMDNRVRDLLKNGDEVEFKIIGLRYFNVYGAGEFHKGSTASMILQLGLSALEKKKVKLFAFGEQMRDFVYINDVIQANIKAIEAQNSGIYNVGSGTPRTFNDIIAILKAELGEFEVEFIQNPYSFYQNFTQANISSTKENIFYEPRYSLESGIKDYINEIRKLAKC